MGKDPRRSAPHAPIMSPMGSVSSATAPDVGKGLAPPIMGQEEAQMPIKKTLISNYASPSNMAELSVLEGLAPRLIRRRSAPEGHRVIFEESMLKCMKRQRATLWRSTN